MGLALADDGWRLPDTLWARRQTLLSPRKPHPLGCHRPRVDDQWNGILFVLRTGCSETHCRPPAFVLAVRRIGVFARDSTREYLKRSGSRACGARQ